MTDHQFNALEYVHQLTRAGVPLAQAEAHANALAGVLEIFLPIVTDVATLKQMVADLKDRMVNLKDRVDDLKDRMDEMGRRIDRVETRLNWAIGILVASQLALFGMIGGLYMAH